MTDISANLSKTSKGKRYGDLTKNFYNALCIIGVPRSAHLMTHNLCGPGESTQKRSRTKHQFNHKPALPNDKHFEYLANIYTDIKSSKGIVIAFSPSGNFRGRDSDNQPIQWDPKSDECWGFCGKKAPSYECNQVFVHVIGDEDDAYSILQAACKDNKTAGYAHTSCWTQFTRSFPQRLYCYRHALQQIHVWYGETTWGNN